MLDVLGQIGVALVDERDVLHLRRGQLTLEQLTSGAHSSRLHSRQGEDCRYREYHKDIDEFRM